MYTLFPFFFFCYLYYWFSYHCGALTSQGKLLTWGNYSSGALGHGNISEGNHPIPKYVETLDDKFVFAIGFGGWQSSVLAINRVEDDDSNVGVDGIHDE